MKVPISQIVNIRVLPAIKNGDYMFIKIMYMDDQDKIQSTQGYLSVPDILELTETLGVKLRQAIVEGWKRSYQSVTLDDVTFTRYNFGPIRF
jgi:hypothetical protein